MGCFGRCEARKSQFLLQTMKTIQQRRLLAGDHNTPMKSTVQVRSEEFSRRMPLHMTLNKVEVVVPINRRPQYGP